MTGAHIESVQRVACEQAGCAWKRSHTTSLRVSGCAALAGRAAAHSLRCNLLFTAQRFTTVLLSFEDGKVATARLLSKVPILLPLCVESMVPPVSRYWKFATARRQKPPPRAAGGGVGAPAEHLHSQLHGLKRKAATRRRQQPASPNPEPVHAGEAPRPDPAAGHAPAGAGRRGHAYSTGPTAEEGRQKAAPSVRPVAAAPGAAAAPRSGVPRSVRVAEPPLAHAGAAPMAGHHAPDAADWRHAAAARGGEGFAGEQEGARARRSGREPMHVRSRGGMGREGFEGVIAGARRSGKGLDRAGGEGAGVLHVVRCAREFLADVRGQRLSNNVVASALQVHPVPCCRG